MDMTVEDVRALLAGRFGGDVSDVALLGAGVWSRAYAFNHAGRGYVARLGAYVEDYFKDRFAAQFSSAALPIPRVILVDEAPGGYLAVAERHEGEHIDGVSGAQMQALLPALFAALDAARQADLSATTGFGAWGPDGHGARAGWRDVLLAVNTDDPAATRIHGWRQKLATSSEALAAHDEAYARLVELSEGLPEERHLIHSDLLHYNVLVQAERITAVLDWGCSLYGDHLYDLAWLLYWQPWFPAWREIDFLGAALRHWEAIGLNVPDWRRRLTCCLVHIGLGEQAYQASAGLWDMLRETTPYTLAIARRGEV